MKLGIVLALSSLVLTQAAHINDVSPAPTAPPQPIEKRYKDVVVNPKYKEQEAAKSAKTTTTNQPKPWIRTLASDKKEIVTPTVIASVTFGAKPPKTTNGMEPWVSLKKNGQPTTIKPKIKNGIIQNGSPTYGTWFATATTVTYNKEELKAHNMAEDELFVDEQHIEEDPYEHSLNPLLRCTPDYYAMRGLAKDKSTEPVCFPRDNEVWYMGNTYFVTWYSNYFKDAEKVKVHLSYVKENIYHVGTKRDNVSEEEIVEKRSVVLDKGGTLEKSSFFDSDWLPRTKGWFPVTVDKDWFGEGVKNHYKKVLISIQPDNIADEDFDFMTNPIVVEIAKGAKVNKESYKDLKEMEAKLKNQHVSIEVEEGIDEKYYVIIGMPTAVLIAAVLMYLFVYINKGYTDLSHLKKVKFARNKTKKKLLFKRKNKDYAELPQFNNDIELTKND